jgi:hypothetical protein
LEVWGLKLNVHDEIWLDLNRCCKSTTGARNMGFAPVHTKI